MLSRLLCSLALYQNVRKPEVAALEVQESETALVFRSRVCLPLLSAQLLDRLKE
jgi:hypothetical protein